MPQLSLHTISVTSIEIYFFVAMFTYLFKLTCFCNPQITEVDFRICLILVLNNRRGEKKIYVEHMYMSKTLKTLICLSKNTRHKLASHIVDINFRVTLFSVLNNRWHEFIYKWNLSVKLLKSLFVDKHILER